VDKLLGLYLKNFCLHLKRMLLPFLLEADHHKNRESGDIAKVK